jgi:lipopolysaccharide transport system permease protein
MDNQSNNKPSGGDWTMVIRPKRNLLELDLKEIWRYRDLIFLFVKRDFVAKYKQTILGPLWFIIQPLLTTLMFTVVFGKIAGIPTEGLPNILFYLAGIVGWNYFATCLNETSATFITNASIFGKVYFPRLTLPVSIVSSSLITFVIQFIFLIAFIVFYAIRGVSIQIGPEILLVPLLVVMMAGLGLGFGIIISSMTTKYRDLLHLVKFGVQLWMA